MTLLIIIHIAATLAMAGIIWSVQCVQYPLFAQVDHSHFARYHEAHMRRIGFVVGPLMLAEAMTGIALLWSLPPTPKVIAAFALLAVAWVSTLALQVPLHRELASSWSADSVRRLVRGNWIRTVAWSARAAILLSVVPQWLNQ